MQTFAAPTEAPSSSRRSRWLGPALPLAVSVLLVSMVAHFRVPLLPAIGRDLAMSPSELGWIATLFAVGRLALDLPAGRLADRFDPLRLLAAAAAGMAVGSVAMAAAPSAAWVLAASVVIGAASATGNTTGMTALAGSAPARRRGSAMALYSGSLLGGQALGPTVGGAVTTLGTWRTSLYAAAVLGTVIALGAVVWSLREGHVSVQRVVSKPGERGHSGLARRQVVALYGVGFSVFFTLGAMPQTLVPLIGAIDHDLRAAAIGAALGLGGVARIVGAAASGAISDRVSRRAALIPALVLQAGGVALLAVGRTPAWWLVAIVLMSVGSSGNAVAATMLGDRTDGATLGRTLGRYRFAGDVGLVVGPALAAFVFDVAGASAAVALVTGILLLCAAAAAVVVPETHAPRTS